jgi:hypothetical protein
VVSHTVYSNLSSLRDFTCCQSAVLPTVIDFISSWVPIDLLSTCDLTYSLTSRQLVVLPVVNLWPSLRSDLSSAAVLPFVNLLSFLLSICDLIYCLTCRLLVVLPGVDVKFYLLPDRGRTCYQPVVLPTL